MLSSDTRGQTDGGGGGLPSPPASLTHQSVVTFCIVYAITAFTLLLIKAVRIFLEEPTHTYIDFGKSKKPTYTNKVDNADGN